MTEHVKCECGALFGIEQPDGTLAIKYRDLFRIVKGSVSGPCRKCGANMVWQANVLPAQTNWWTMPNTTTMPTYPGYFSCNCACNRCNSGDCCMVPR